MPTRHRAEVSLATSCYRGHKPVCDSPYAGDVSLHLLPHTSAGEYLAWPYNACIQKHNQRHDRKYEPHETTQTIEAGTYVKTTARGLCLLQCFVRAAVDCAT